MKHHSGNWKEGLSDSPELYSAGLFWYIRLLICLHFSRFLECIFSIRLLWLFSNVWNLRIVNRFTRSVSLLFLSGKKCFEFLVLSIIRSVCNFYSIFDYDNWPITDSEWHITEDNSHIDFQFIELVFESLVKT